MKRVAIIGARSMLGRAIVRRLEGLGVSIISVGRSDGDDIHLDLGLEPGSVWQSEYTVDIVFNCAAAFCDDSDVGFEKNLKVNTFGALQTVVLTQKLSASAMIYAGSIFSNENDPENFNSYGLTKSMAEQIFTWAFKRFDARFCSLRFSQLYDSEGLCCSHQPWFGRIVAYAARGVDIRIPRSLGPRNFLHVEDAADMMIAAGQGNVAGIVNAAHPQSLSIQQIAQMAYDVFGLGGKIEIASEKAPFRKVAFPEYKGIFPPQVLLPPRTMRDGLEGIKHAGTFAAFGPMDVN